MAAIQQLLRRWGFVKLGRYGLVLTPDGRILSTRPAILDDGSGGRIVGWEAGDLAMAELAPWEPASPPSTPVVASRGAMPQAAAPVKPAAPSYQTEAPVRPEIAQPRAVATRPGAAVAVAPEPTVDEDDWEWTIALARARADSEAAVAAPSPLPLDLATQDTAPVAPAALPAPRAPRTRPMAVVAMKDPATSGEWPKTATIGSIDYEDSRVATREVPRSPTGGEGSIAGKGPRDPSGRSNPRGAIPRLASAAPTPSRPGPSPAPLPSAAAPVTVIPVPTLPTVHGTIRAGRLEPVVRPAVRVPPRRFPKGTGPVDSRTERYFVDLPDDTDTAIMLEDRTKPGIALPPAARAVSLPSIKRRGTR